MKTGVSYNVFDGVELLEDSIKCIRNSVDYICVIYQEISNFGKRSQFDNKKELKRLFDNKLIDDVFLYNPIKGGHGHLNEIHKRQIGMDKCIERDCKIHMSMDCDEFYKQEQFERCLDEFKNNEYNGSACKMMTYYHSYEYQIDPPEEYYVPMFFKVESGDVYHLMYNFPVLVDPTRRIKNKDNIKIYQRKEIEMHHMSYVRKNIQSFSEKLHNSSASINFTRKGLREVLEHWEKWEYPMNAKTIGTQVNEFKTKKVDSSWIK